MDCYFFVKELFAGYLVCRQDDNGNKYIIEVTKCKADANQILMKYEGNTHKQIYWVEMYRENI
jgi:hypothetical protein